jgi:hypothetical protein
MLRKVSKAEAGLLNVIRNLTGGTLTLTKHGDGGWTLALSDEPKGKATHAGSGNTFDECWRALRPIVRPAETEARRD